ncbi:RNA polymerase sigma factor [Paenibacillus allorhizosphaerae]|uniref:RNA polymerase sigma factor n=1 Tax=Paenibacillus allorhizosphaerae TaxID=2849866 RepID=A0ABM8VPY9_9BACL|nr:sigma-70 family RNA polymerase sigma factor [Paenibacillus allorhizosphaerae]CAG7653513.1 RNA polymerase sigma-H factor [Paenibacillus allorhizosphaerae]
MQEQSDLELVEQLRQGNMEAYTPLIEKYKGKIFGLLYRMIGHTQDAQDLAQDVFIKAYNRIQSCRNGAGFSSWLFRIAYNHALDELRKRKRRPLVTSDEAEAIYQETPESIYLEKERIAVLHERVMALDEDYRTVVLLRYVEGLSYKEIGAVLSLPVTTVQMRLYRAHHRLREVCLLPVKGDSDYGMHEI